MGAGFPGTLTAHASPAINGGRPSAGMLIPGNIKSAPPITYRETSLTCSTTKYKPSPLTKPHKNLKSSDVVFQPFFCGEERTESETRPKSVPLVNIEGTDWMWKAFLPEGSDRDHPVVNVFGPNAVDISGVDFPATIVFVGGFDPLQDWQKRYYEGLNKRGKQAELLVFPNAIHTSYAYPELEDSSAFINRVRDFVQNAIC